MALLSEKDRTFLEEKYARELEGEVKIVVFTQKETPLAVPGLECTYCKETRELAEELAATSPKISLEVHDFHAEPEVAQKYRVDRIPALALLGPDGWDPGVRFFGIPAGYEFATVVTDLVFLSRMRTDLSPSTVEALKNLESPAHIMVFVTPTCPYCPRAASLAHQMAMASDLVTAEAIEATEFPHLANRYNVYGVPKVVINDRVEFEGALPEEAFLDFVIHAARSSGPDLHGHP